MWRTTINTSWVRHWYDTLFPPHCVLCDADCGENLCASCREHCPILGSHCRTCAREMAEAGLQCGYCLRRPPAIDAFFARWHYRERVRDLVLGGKYQADKGRLLVMAEEMLALLPSIPAADVVIPMPISRRRLWQRGFNQTHILAKPIARALHIPLNKTLLIKHHRPPQTRQHTHGARRRNIRNAFSCHAPVPARILLIDDVATSGATLNEAAKILKQHGAEQVYALVAAAH